MFWILWTPQEKRKQDGREAPPQYGGFCRRPHQPDDKDKMAEEIHSPNHRARDRAKGKKNPAVQLNLHDYKTPSCHKQQQRGNKDKTKETWRTWRGILFQNQSNFAEPFAPYHLTGFLLVVAALLTVATGSGAADKLQSCKSWRKRGGSIFTAWLSCVAVAKTKVPKKAAGTGIACGNCDQKSC